MPYPHPLTAVSPTDFAIQSTPQHVALIMDGNRRWARQRGLPAAAGHRAGIDALRALLPALKTTGIQTLSLFAFSSANWQRPSAEVTHLLKLAEHALERFAPVLQREQIALEIFGRRDRLPGSLLTAAERLSRQTRTGSRQLRIALDYSSRESILQAARAHTSMDAVTGALCSAGPVDLLIRTGREQRLSDFLLWESAFAELYFPDIYWPEFDCRTLNEALAWFSRRNRRFGV